MYKLVYIYTYKCVCNYYIFFCAVLEKTFVDVSFRVPDTNSILRIWFGTDREVLLFKSIFVRYFTETTPPLFIMKCNFHTDTFLILQLFLFF